MYYQRQKGDGPNVWLNVDPVKVKQRIDRITQRLEQVRHQFESAQPDNSINSQQQQELTVPAQKPANKGKALEDGTVNQTAKS